ncbi:DUF4142 domain-containing protein [Sphingobium sp. DC-2]|uniref:DUF4142 domain-containing protein n=1 Tax=Sphingobium sp. DC-2 TaxID=1303256 RepID=UPI0004C2F2BC|nr:DUF4142 domain-containing protein [Sphingobium sp. DC-2]
MNRMTFMILATGLTLAACNEATEQRAENAAGSAAATADAAGDRIENAADNAMAALTPTPSAQEFANKAAKSDAFEIAAAKLAAVKASSAEVKAFAAQMIKAHTESSAKIKAAAGKAKPAVTIDAALTADQKEDLADLQKLTGAKFDEEYIDGQVDAHEDALALMRSYASGGTDAGLKTAAGEIAAVVEGHLKMARDLEAKTDR